LTTNVVTAEMLHYSVTCCHLYKSS